MEHFHFPIKPFNSYCKFLFSSSTSDDLQMISIHGDRLDFSTTTPYPVSTFKSKVFPPKRHQSIIHLGPPLLFPLPPSPSSPFFSWLPHLSLFSLFLSNCSSQSCPVIGHKCNPPERPCPTHPAMPSARPVPRQLHPLQLQPPSFLFPIRTGANPPCRNERSGTVEMLRNLRRIRSGRVIIQPVISPFPAEGDHLEIVITLAVCVAKASTKVNIDRFKIAVASYYEEHGMRCGQ
ncbi:uncharacterized protein BO87DRAFT_229 [Aspergillus neoniger CBS 115656]|uniref:Uncharacterized protein n=1 Tax=Aspergillus neoniger (strain CBS 115656) TaxID=1448310 RepID=A0A318Z6X6_ASPNB|nr:hypothetical protein BO87DRAFT_229 [Aspergillus neoniger CBS 115656]PYH39470.1 hypothetical protein BO87DRAFT_229 [Aspergillus neoniger CBS 115656]